MHKDTIFYAAVLLLVYFTLVFCEETESNEAQISDMDTMVNVGRSLQEFEGRTRRRHHHFWYRHLWPLAIAYWIKVKVVIVSFFLGSAIYLGLRYFWPHRCNQEIILDHPPPSFDHHDHVPYSLDHSSHFEHYDGPTSFDSSSFEPYSAYSSFSGGSDIASGPGGTTNPTAPASIRRRGKRSTEENAEDYQETQDEEDERVEEIDEEISDSVARQMPTEEQIADFMFAFLGLDSKACRRRFICEMEFRSKMNPLTSMAFRIVGRSFFEKYTNAHNPEARATNFNECASVNPQCVFIESQADVDTDLENENTTDSINDVSVSGENTLESQNEQNLKAERRHAKLKNRRGDRMLRPIAERILTQTQ